MKKLRILPVRRAITAFLCTLMVFYTLACSYYKVAIKKPGDIPTIAAQQSHKIMFLHNGDEVYLIKSLTVSEEGNSQNLALELAEANVPVSLLPHRTDYPTNDTPDWDTIYEAKPLYYPDRKKKYNSTQEGAIIREVHFYLTQYIAGVAPGSVNLPASSFKEIHVLKNDAGKTILEVLLIGTGIFLATIIILALTKSSCPYVYVFDGANYQFQGEIFSGAVLSNLERGDHLPLPLLQSEKGEYRLRIAHELKEKQFVNVAEMQAIRHPSGTQALFDAHGAPQLIAAPQLPLKALSALGEDINALISQKDQQAFLFDEERAPKNSLTLHFTNKPGKQQPKLVLKAKNSLWFDYLFGRFAEKLGVAYPGWISQQESLPREERLARQNDQDFPLSVYLKTSDGQWQLAGRLPLAGPLGWRDMVLPLDPDMLQGEVVEVRLETGYRFWEVDYAALDFSENAGLEVLTLQPQYAKDQDGQSQRKALAADDDQYLKQLRTGDYTELHFKALAPPPTGQAQSLFLHTKGYYMHVRDFSGEPQIVELQKFLQPHHFDQFSKAEYRRIQAVTCMDSDAIHLNQ